MDLQDQIQALIENAPPDEATQEGVQAVANALSEVAQGLGHPEYYVLQNFQQQWQVTTLQHRTQDTLQKTVLYAYAHLADATQAGQSEDLIAFPVPIVQLLFQFFSFDNVDSFLFLDNLHDPDQIREIKRQDLQALVHAFLEEHLERQHSTDAFDNIA
jgi:hypothetical protein